MLEQGNLQSNSTHEITILLSDIPTTILLAAATADSAASLQSQIFQKIVKQVAIVQQTQAAYQSWRLLIFPHILHYTKAF